MNLARRRFLFMAPAIIAAPKLMKLSAKVIEPKLWWTDDNIDRVTPFTTENLRFKVTERYVHGFMDARLFRQIVEPTLREHFDGVFKSEAEVVRLAPVRVQTTRADSIRRVGRVYQVVQEMGRRTTHS